MAITSVGFAGNVDAVQWARLSDELGQEERIVSGLAVTTVPGGTRQVSVAAGVSYAHGVLATLAPAQTVTFANVTSGTRWDAVCIRRDWGAGTATLVVVSGSSTEQVPSSLNDNPGTLHDQPIALVQITAGQTVPTAVRVLVTDKRTQTFFAARSVITGEEDTANVPDGEVWPNGGSSQVYVPRWATTAVITHTWAGVNNQGGNASGQIAVAFGSQSTQTTNYSSAGADQNRQVLHVADTLVISASQKGRVITVSPRAKGPSTGLGMLMDAGSSHSLHIQFKE